MLPTSNTVTAIFMLGTASYLLHAAFCMLPAAYKLPGSYY